MTEQPANQDILGAEIEPVAVAPKLGTLAWVQAQDTVERDGVTLPHMHRVPADATIAPADESSKCRVTYASGERCKGTRLKAYGLCMGHVGGGGASDLSAMSAKGAAKLKQLRVSREILGIGPRSAGNPRVAMRLRAAQRADELASAVVDGPLDADLSPLERQRAALAAIDASFPLQAATLSLTVDDPETMSWNDMQRVASSLLG